jgi:hypothetical protein
VIGLRLDLIHADPRIVTMFWDRARYSVLDGRSSVGLLYGTKFGVRCEGVVSTPVRKWQGLAARFCGKGGEVVQVRAWRTSTLRGYKRRGGREGGKGAK